MKKWLKEIIRVMRQTHNVDISPYDEGFLLKSLGARLADTGIKTPAAYCEHLTKSSTEAKMLSDSLGIIFSEFFRNQLTFAHLEQLILPGIISEAEKTGRAEIRVWSAGCATGEEAYSVAILLDVLFASRGGNGRTFRIFATDRSEAALATARKGVYDTTAVQNVRLKHLREYFIPEGETYALIPGIREQIAFSAYDLLDERSAYPPASIYGDFDLVICSNLLLYYHPDIRQCILNKIYRSLAPNGYLVTGEAEREIAAKTVGFRSSVVPMTCIFRRA